MILKMEYPFRSIINRIPKIPSDFDGSFNILPMMVSTPYHPLTSISDIGIIAGKIYRATGR
jgi:hypothetical protein